MKAWNRAGLYTGEEHAALRQALRGMAQDADALYVDGKHAQAARVRADLFDRLEQLRPKADTRDAFDEFLADLDPAAT